MERVGEVPGRDPGARALQDGLERQHLDRLEIRRELAAGVEAPAALPEPHRARERGAEVLAERLDHRRPRLERAGGGQRGPRRAPAGHRVEDGPVGPLVEPARRAQRARERLRGIVALAGDRDAAQEEEAPRAGAVLEGQRPLGAGAPDLVQEARDHRGPELAAGRRGPGQHQCRAARSAWGAGHAGIVRAPSPDTKRTTGRGASGVHESREAV